MNEIWKRARDEPTTDRSVRAAIAHCAMRAALSSPALVRFAQQSPTRRLIARMGSSSSPAAAAAAAKGSPDPSEPPAAKKAKKAATKKPPPYPEGTFPQTPAPRRLQPLETKTPDGRATFKALAWNVAGLRALMEKNPGTLRAIVDAERPDVLCLQEHKLQDVHVSDLTTKLKTLLPEYPTVRFAVSTKKKGYSGVAVIARAPIEGDGDGDGDGDAKSDDDDARRQKQGTLAGFVAAAPRPPPSDASLASKPKLLGVVEGLGGNGHAIGKHADEGRLLTMEYETHWLVLAYVPNSGASLSSHRFPYDRVRVVNAVS
jgi:exodeoxyribonuclease-3/AP endonuclease-1